MRGQDHWDEGFEQVGETDWARKSWNYFGMEYVDPKYVVAWHPETNEPLIAINPDEGKISVDPRYIDSDAFFEDVYRYFDSPTKANLKEKGFGRYMK